MWRCLVPERFARGFSLVELVVVIAIIAILASLSMPVYTKYSSKSKVVSYALPILRACMSDIASHCSINSPMSGTETYAPIGDSRFPNCRENTTTAGGTVVMETINSPQCNQEGVLTAGAVKAYISDSGSSYVAKCEVTIKPFRCYVDTE